MKYVYVLTSSEKDLYYEQFFLSVTSLRIHNPNAHITALIDSRTKNGLTGIRANYENIISETIVIQTPPLMSQKEASRWIKTSMKKYIKGDFLYIDCDTVIADSLEYDFPLDIKVGAIIDTHVPLSKHHHTGQFMEEDNKVNFDSSSILNKRFNGGVIFCRDTPEADDFFDCWHTLWNESRKRGNMQDMPSLNQAYFKKNQIIKELDGKWNCQIIYNGLPFLHEAKIIHYFATVFDFINCPFLPASRYVLNDVKKTGIICSETMDMLHNPRGAFESTSRIIYDKEEIDVVNSKLFLLLLIFKKKYPKLFKSLNSFVIHLRNNKFIRKIYHRPRDGKKER